MVINQPPTVLHHNVALTLVIMDLASSSAIFLLFMAKKYSYEFCYFFQVFSKRGISCDIVRFKA